MTYLYFTVDTEYSLAFFQRHGKAARVENFNGSILGKAAGEEAGIVYQMEVLDRHGLKGVFFVDPMPALIWGVSAIADIVEPIVSRGHDVQLHIHTEWLAFAGATNPLPGRTGRDIKDFHLDEQTRLLDYARRTLIAAGAPAPIAFRAGNYGANDDTLRALGRLGMRFDSSHCPGIYPSPCAITLDEHVRDPVEHCGVIEVPVGCIGAPRARLRHFQLTALTAAEIIAALVHGAAHARDSLTLVCHSFELLSRDRTRVNRIVKRRFKRVCAALAQMRDASTATYATHPPKLATEGSKDCEILPHNGWRTTKRYIEQAVSNTLYGSR